MLLNFYLRYLRGEDHPGRLRVLRVLEKFVFLRGRRPVETQAGFQLLAGPDDVVEKRVLEEGIFEPLTLEFLSRNMPKGGTALCSGTAFGLHLMTLAKVAGSDGRLFGVDAQPHALSNTHLNLMLNEDRFPPTITLVCAALGNAEDRIMVQRPAATSVSHSCLVWPREKEPRSFSTPLHKMETLWTELGQTRPPDVVVLDIDGGEPEVFASLRKGWRPPLIVFEHTPSLLETTGQKSERGFLLLQKLGYKISTLHGKPIEHEETGPETNLVASLTDVEPAYLSDGESSSSV